jgi:hypothetical protein
MDNHKLHVHAACDSNMVKWNSFEKSFKIRFCKIFTHLFLKVLLFLLGVYCVFGINRYKTSMASEYPEFKR